MLNAIDKSLAERDANVDKFCNHLDKDIAELAKEVKEVKQESQVSSHIVLGSPGCMCGEKGPNGRSFF